MKVSDFQLMCRICTKNSIFMSLLETYSDYSLKLYEMLEFCTSIPVRKNDKLPLGICRSCLIELCSSYNFKLRSLKTLKMFVDTLGAHSNVESTLDNYQGGVIEEVKRFGGGRNYKVDNCLVTDDKYLVPNDSNNCSKDDVPIRPISSKINCNVLLVSINSTSKDIDDICDSNDDKNVTAFEKFGHLEDENDIGQKPKDLNKLRCNICHKILSSHRNLLQHMNKHSGVKPFECEQCNKKFIRIEHLRIHKRIHTGEKPYKCEVCSKQFVQYAALLVHMRVHNGERPHMCSTCGKTFTQSVSLTCHMRIHTGETPYCCKICNKGFAHSGNLKIHMRFHQNERRFICTMCSKRFVTSSHLNVHLKQHLGDKQHKCNICSKSFVRSQHLKDHLVIHSGLKPYACQLCPKEYTQKSHLKRHMKSHC